MNDLHLKLLKTKIESFDETGNSFYLSGAISDYNQSKLKSEASWWGSRLWARFSLLAIPKEERKLRLRMIAAAKESKDLLKKIELHLTSKDIDKAISVYYEFADSFLDTFVDNFKILVKEEQKRTQKEPALLPEKKEVVYEEAFVPPEDDESRLQALGSIKNHLMIAVDNKLSSVTSSDYDEAEIKKLAAWHSNLLKEVRKAIDNKDFSQIEPLQGKTKLLEDTLDKILEEISKKISYLIDDDLKKVAQSAIRRWVSRKLLEMSPSMLEQRYLKIVDDILQLHPVLGRIMDKLEDKEVSIMNMAQDVTYVIKTIKSINDRLLGLAQHIRVTQKKLPFKSEIVSELRNISRKLSDIETKGFVEEGLVE